MGIFSPDVWTHCNYIAETFGDMFLTHCDTSVPTFTILRIRGHMHMPYGMLWCNAVQVVVMMVQVR